VGQGRLKLSDNQLMPQWRNATDGHERILLQHLLQQSSGLDFEEDYSKSSDATRMLTQQPSMADYTAGLPMREEAGSRFYYSSGNSNILSNIVRQKLGEAAYFNYVFDSVLYPLGMNSAVWEPDASGTLVGSSYLWASPQDWARFGQLYLQKGQWMGRQLVPASWVAASVQPGLPDNGKHYGFQWWLNTGTDGKGAERMLPGLPVDAFMAEGFEGQFVCVVPSLQLVVVRMGQTPNGRFDNNQFLQGLIKRLPPSAR
jgi:CubicO group peptidase (beta-lactamase class C family)